MRAYLFDSWIKIISLYRLHFVAFLRYLLCGILSNVFLSFRMSVQRKNTVIHNSTENDILLLIYLSVNILKFAAHLITQASYAKSFILYA